MAHAVLDRCMTETTTEDNADIVNSTSRRYEITFDFEFIEDWRTSIHLERSLNAENCNLSNSNTNISDHFSPRKRTFSVASTLNSRVEDKQSDTIRLEKEEEEQATKWKPEGFFKQHHPLHLMVSIHLSNSVRNVHCLQCSWVVSGVHLSLHWITSS